MKQRLMVCGVLVGVAFVILTPGYGEEEAQDVMKEEMQKLTGTWKPVGVETSAGQKELLDRKLAASLVVMIRNGRVQSKKKDGMFHGATLRIDPSKLPKTMDAVNHDVEDKEVPFGIAVRKRQMIYELTGDTLKICYNTRSDGAGLRPTAFATDAERMTVVYRRLVLGEKRKTR